MTRSQRGSATVTLPDDLKGSLRQGHPWVYRDRVPLRFQATTGDIVRFKVASQTGWGLWDSEGPIALRVLSTRKRPDAGWVASRVQLAWELRAPLRGAGVTAFRWIHGEGDALPGIVVDLYERFAVLVCYGAASETLVPWVLDGLQKTLRLDGVLRRYPASGGPPRSEVMAGEAPPDEIVVREHDGALLLARLRRGQKTGLFLDQRDNRHAVRAMAGGRRVLNLFSYNGGFSTAAALGGATRTVSVDIAPAAADDARAIFQLNGLDPAVHDFIVADCFAFLDDARSSGGRFDMVVCDPPSFAHNKEQRRQALRAYAKLNTAALSLVEPGGLYCASSCTAQIGPEDFRKMLAEAAATARRRFQVIQDVGHAIDHPIGIGHPEGRYLKFVVGRVTSAP